MRRILLALALALAAASVLPAPALALQPTGEASCNLWIRTDVNNGYSDLGTTPVTNGGAIEQYDDACASGDNLTQTTSARRPTWNASAFNGHGAIDFASASTQYLQDANASATTDPGTIIVAYIMTKACGYNASPGQAIASAEATSGSYAAYDFYPCSNFNATLEQGRAYGRTPSGGTDQSWFVKGQEFTNLPVVMAVRNDGTHLYLYTEGTQVSTSTLSGTAIGVSSALTIFGCGQYSAAVQNCLSGHVMEIQRYSADIGDADVQALVSDVKSRYGITHRSSGAFIGAFSEGAATETSPYYLDQSLYLVDSDLGAGDLVWHLSNFIPGGTCNQPVGRPSVAQFAVGQNTWLAYSEIIGGTGFWIAGSSDTLLSPVIRFTCGKFIDMTGVPGGATFVNHPRWVVDASSLVHIVVTAGTNQGAGTGNQRSAVYELHPLNAGSTNCSVSDNCNMSTATWSSPVAITGSSFSNAESDADLKYQNGTYCLLDTDENSGLPGAEVPTAFTSTSPFSGYGTGTQLPTPFGYTGGNAYARAFTIFVNGAIQTYMQWSQGSGEVEQYYWARAAGTCNGSYGGFTATNNIFLSPGHLQAGHMMPSPYPVAGKLLPGPFGENLWGDGAGG